MYQDEDEGVEKDGGGPSVCSQRRDDSWFVLIFASFQSSVIKEAVDKNARALIELFTRREPRSDSFATSSPHGAQFGQKLNPPFSNLLKSVGKIYKVTGEQNLLQVPDSELLETPLKSAALVSALGMWVEKIIMTLLLI